MILSIWEGAYRLVGWRSFIFPAPSHVVDGFAGVLGWDTQFGSPLDKDWPMGPPSEGPARPVRRPLVMGTCVSLLRLVEGFSVSLLLGTALGVAMWRVKAIDEFLGPLFLGLQTLPSVCWAPLAMLLFGLQEMGILFVLVAGSFFAIAIALRDGLSTIPPLYQRAGLMLGARGWQLYRHVLLPASLPAMASGLRQGFSFSWRSLMGAELIIEVKDWEGLGKLLNVAQSVIHDPGRVMALMLVMVLIGMAADRLVFAPLQLRVQRRFGLEGGSPQ
jgi:NitT/TauT family transport system permease protein